MASIFKKLKNLFQGSTFFGSQGRTLEFQWRNYKKILPVILVVVILAIAIFGPVTASAENIATKVVSSVFGSLVDFNNISINVLTKFILFLTFYMMSWAAGMLTIVGFGFDFVVNYTISGFANLAGNTGIVGIGWEI